MTGNELFVGWLSGMQRQEREGKKSNEWMLYSLTAFTASALHRPKLDGPFTGSLLSGHVLGAAPSGHIRSVHNLSKLKRTATLCIAPSHKFGASDTR